MLQFQNISGLPDEVLAQTYGLKDKAGWSLTTARKRVQADGNPQSKIHPILYRPFDVRFIFYHEAVIERPRPEVMRHMLAGKNLGLLVMRQVALDEDYTHALVTPYIIDNRVFASAKGIALECPLYLYPSTTAPEMFQQSKTPNLAKGLLPKLSAAYGFILTPEEILTYIYAVLYSPPYRARYADVGANHDSPLRPFRQMAALGQELIDLHLLRKTVQVAGVRYQGQGSDTIERVRYEAATGQVWINQDKYFENITPETWSYRIGGYQVLEKYLKDRKGRALTDPIRYLHIAEAIAQTIAHQVQLNALYEAVEMAVMVPESNRDSPVPTLWLEGGDAA
ncbi:MAG: hypothetical protein KatS3mg055_1042 [Chloroflexus sp.]|nr:MAG: hypothetical protein KatS3mg055_1042 [Chloroflexus sp.]